MRKTLFLLAMGLAMVGEAATLTNGGLQFTFPGHVNGDTGHGASGIAPNGWVVSANGFISTDPQGIFNFTSEYMQVQTTSAGRIYQQVTLVANGDYELSMDASYRNDNVFPGGVGVMRLYSGTILGTLLTPTTQSTPGLTTAIQHWTATYAGLTAGTYTVEVGGTWVSGTLFQMGLDNVALEAVAAPVPEPGTVGLLIVGGVLVGWRRRRG